MEIDDLGLHIVPTELVTPHEREDPRRVERLSASLRKEGWLKNPPLVVAHDGRYVLLDGTTRTKALASLGYPHTLVQVVDPARVRVSTWNHLVIGLPIEAFWEQLQALEPLALRRLDGASLAQSQHRWAGGLYLADERAYSIELPPDAPVEEEIDLLNRLVALYTGEREIRRSLKSNPHELMFEHPDLTGILSFPQYTVHDIVQFGLAEFCVPPGITRCIIPGRVLRVNLDLSLLNSEVLTLEQKNARLREYIHARITRQPLRYYEEPIYILED